MKWAVTLRGLLVFRNGAPRVLDAAEGALWDLLSRGTSLEDAARMLAAIVEFPPADVQTLVRRCLAEWSEAGLIEVTSG